MSPGTMSFRQPAAHMIMKEGLRIDHEPVVQVFASPFTTYTTRLVSKRSTDEERVTAQVLFGMSKKISKDYRALKQRGRIRKF